MFLTVRSIPLLLCFSFLYFFNSFQSYCSYKVCSSYKKGYNLTTTTYSKKQAHSSKHTFPACDQNRMIHKRKNQIHMNNKRLHKRNETPRQVLSCCEICNLFSKNVFREYRKGSVAWYGLIRIHSLSKHISKNILSRPS